MTSLTISVVGLGYIGLPTAAMFASRKVKGLPLDFSDVVISVAILSPQ